MIPHYINSNYKREKPGESEWQSLADMKIPFLLNYSQCQLLLENYYDVIEQCTQVLILQPGEKPSHFTIAFAVTY